MKLSENEKAMIIANYPMLAPGLPKIKCPICGDGKPILEEDCYAIPSIDEPRAIKVAVVRCPKCNHVDLFALPPQEG